MSTPYWDTTFPTYIKSACGATAKFDYGAGYGYRCEHCMAVLGSIGMPRDCYNKMKEQEEMKQIVDKLKGCYEYRNT